MNRYLLTILFVIPNNVLAHISNLVLPVSYSVNRVELLTELKYKLAKYRSTSLVGISGIGKTQLTRSYGYNQQDKYDLIWFIDCSLDINEELLKLAKAINLSVKTNLIPEDVLIVKKSIIDYLTSQNRWLIVFDNLKVGENQKIQEFLNWEHNGNVITCSQDMESLPNIISINQLSQDDAMILANNILEAKHDEFSAWLAKTFNGYPLLIMQGAQLANHLPVLDKEEYKKKILNAANQIKSNIILTMSKLKPSARALLAKIALINNQRFSKDLLYLITNNYTLDTDLYQLYEHMLIDRTNKANLEFEMHDVVAQQILKISGKDNI